MITVEVTKKRKGKRLTEYYEFESLPTQGEYPTIEVEVFKRPKRRRLMEAEHLSADVPSIGCFEHPQGNELKRIIVASAIATATSELTRLILRYLLTRRL